MRYLYQHLTPSSFIENGNMDHSVPQHLANDELNSVTSNSRGYNGPVSTDPSLLDAVMEDALQRARAFIEAHQTSENNMDLALTSSNESSTNESLEAGTSAVNIGGDNALDNHVSSENCDSSEYPENDRGLIVDMVPSENVRRLVPFSATQLHKNYCGIRYPLGLYDPFDITYPRNEMEEAWGQDANAFLLGTFLTPRLWDSWIEELCESVSEWDNDQHRTWDWFDVLPFDVQAEVLLQRYFGLRPRSLWIMGPHDDNSMEWWSRYESSNCIIPQVVFPGAELGYGMYCGTQIVEDEEMDQGDGKPEWWSDPAVKYVPQRCRTQRVHT